MTNTTKTIALLGTIILASCASNWGDRYPWMDAGPLNYETAKAYLDNTHGMNCPPNPPTISYDLVVVRHRTGWLNGTHKRGHITLPKEYEDNMMSPYQEVLWHEYAHYCGANETVARLVEGAWTRINSMGYSR